MQFSLHVKLFLSVSRWEREEQKKGSEKGCLGRSPIVLFVFTTQELDVFAKITA